MKKSALLLILIILLPLISTGEIFFLKLRASHHPGFLRIVLEGERSIISKALVYQRGQSVFVNFPDMEFSILTQKVAVEFNKIDRNTLIFFPGDFQGLKVFTLKYPDRLVIDVYLKKQAEQTIPRRPQQKEKKQKSFIKVNTVVIDPGHGGYEYGLVKDGYIEKHIALGIAQKLRTLINRGGSHGFLTRGSDRLMTQKERVEFTNSRDAEVFISLHIGNHQDFVIYVPVITEKVSDIIKPYLYNKGQEKYMHNTLTLLKAMEEAITTEFGNDMVSVRPLPYSILSRIEAAALMIELPSFEDANYDEELKTEIAETLYKGLYIYEEIKIK
jgi:hypothetical protein